MEYDPFSVTNRCKEIVLEHASFLAERVRRGKLTVGAFESLMVGFIDSTPAIPIEQRQAYLKLAMTRV